MSRRPAIITVALCAALSGLAVLGWMASVRRDQRVPRAKITSESIVMLGDSITEQAPWAAAFPDLPIANRGYAGFTTAQLLDVVREVSRARPRAVYVLTGTNDIRDGHPPSWTVRNLEAILDEFTSSTPETVVVVQTVLPSAFGIDETIATNAAIRQLADDRALEIIDLHRAFDDGSGALRAVDTVDGIHLSDAGYRRWTDQLSDHFARPPMEVRTTHRSR